MREQAKSRWRGLTAFFLFLCTVDVAQAEWRVDTFRDRMSDRDIKMAAVSAKSASSGVHARLQIECLDGKFVGRTMILIVLSREFYQHRIGLNWRIDAGPVEPRHLIVNSDLRSIWLANLSVSELSKAKRLRVELFPTGGPTLFYEFDVSGADGAFRAVPCVER